MVLGPGKYDHLCSYVREQVGLADEGGELSRPGGVLLIVINGDKGNGFSCQADQDITFTQLPDMLEAIAKQIRERGPLMP